MCVSPVNLSLSTEAFKQNFRIASYEAFWITNENLSVYGPNDTKKENDLNLS
jgi:hypothetical protein